MASHVDVLLSTDFAGDAAPRLVQQEPLQVETAADRDCTPVQDAMLNGVAGQMEAFYSPLRRVFSGQVGAPR